jgi:hypothetical protein
MTTRFHSPHSARPAADTLIAVAALLTSRRQRISTSSNTAFTAPFQCAISPRRTVSVHAPPHPSQLNATPAKVFTRLPNWHTACFNGSVFRNDAEQVERDSRGRKPKPRSTASKAASPKPVVHSLADTSPRISSRAMTFDGSRSGH